MSYYSSRPIHIDWEKHLLGLSGMIAVACVVFIWQSSDPVTVSIPEVVVPLGVSLGLSVYTHHLKKRDVVSEQAKSMVKYGWVGAVGSGAIGGFWLVLHVYFGLPIDILPDKILTVASLGIAAGVLVGRSSAFDHQESPAIDRNHVLAETSWVNRSGATPIMAAVIEVMAEGKQVDPLELEPLYTHIDPEVLSELQSQTDSPWQFSFYTDEYEIRVSSHGTVTMYHHPEDEVAPALTSR